MALTAAQKQKAYRERQRLAKHDAPDQSASIADAPKFAAFIGKSSGKFEQQLSFIGETLAAVGFDFPDLTKDADPEWTEEWGVENRGSLGKAERMVDAMIDSAKALSEIINGFKLEQVELAKERFARRSGTTADARRRALTQAVRLDRIESRLRKEVRHSFHPIVAKDFG